MISDWEWEPVSHRDPDFMCPPAPRCQETCVLFYAVYLFKLCEGH